MIDDRAKLDAIHAIISAKVTWLHSFSSGRGKRPDHEILLKRREVTILQAIEADYRARLERNNG